MESKKRERAANFNSAEVQLLLRLVDKYKYIIENKKTDAATNREKDAAWKQIENSFNTYGITTSTEQRTWKTLKLKYEGVKKATKKSSLQLQEMCKTGEGAQNASNFNEIEGEVLNVYPNISVLETDDAHGLNMSYSNHNQDNDILSAARLELVQLQIETTRMQHQFIEDEHRLKMVHLANDEERKQELHKLMVEKLKTNSSERILNGIL